MTEGLSWKHYFPFPTLMFDADFIDRYFSENYNGATKNGIIRGAYHFAHPGASSGAAQAEYFLAHGGKSRHIPL